MAIVADIFQAAAHKTKGLVIGATLQLMHPLHSLLVKNIATDSVNRIGGVTDDSPMFECLNDLSNESGLGILRIDAEHKSVMLRGKEKGWLDYIG